MLYKGILLQLIQSSVRFLSDNAVQKMLVTIKLFTYKKNNIVQFLIGTTIGRMFVRIFFAFEIHLEIACFSLSLSVCDFARVHGYMHVCMCSCVQQAIFLSIIGHPITHKDLLILSLHKQSASYNIYCFLQKFWPFNFLQMLSHITCVLSCID